MAGSIFHIKRKVVIGGVLVSFVLLLAFAGLFLFGNKASDPSYAICTSAKYRSVMNGMNKKMVTTLMGQPERKLVKQSSSENYFYQGSDREAKIKEGWIYRQEGHVTAAEIYFNNNGHVNGKGCGQG